MEIIEDKGEICYFSLFSSNIWYLTIMCKIFKQIIKFHWTINPKSKIKIKNLHKKESLLFWMEERMRDHMRIFKKLKLKVAYLAKSWFPRTLIMFVKVFFFFFFFQKYYGVTRTSLSHVKKKKNKFKYFVKIFVIYIYICKNFILFYFNYETRASSILRICTCDRTWLSWAPSDRDRR